MGFSTTQYSEKALLSLPKDRLGKINGQVYDKQLICESVQSRSANEKCDSQQHGNGRFFQ